MSHWLEAKRMLNDPQIGSFIREALHEVFKEGYSFKDPHYSGRRPGVEIYIKNLTGKKSILFDAVMRIMKIEISYPCGLTRQIDGNFRGEIRELKKILISASNVIPDEDKNISVMD